jgi:hypothetical protein
MYACVCVRIHDCWLFLSRAAMQNTRGIFINGVSMHVYMYVCIYARLFTLRAVKHNIQDFCVYGVSVYACIHVCVHHHDCGVPCRVLSVICSGGGCTYIHMHRHTDTHTEDIYGIHS